MCQPTEGIAILGERGNQIAAELTVRANYGYPF
jgi:hypothetical protein